MHPEQYARQEIDRFHTAAGWHVCSINQADIHAALRHKITGSYAVDGLHHRNSSNGNPARTRNRASQYDDPTTIVRDTVRHLSTEARRDQSEMRPAFRHCGHSRRQQ